ncbi:hypothetical protein DOS86_01430 [Anaplasma marginale]|nr:hypothetical protein DOS86_01430 [Anaplasma marginale]
MLSRIGMRANLDESDNVRRKIISSVDDILKDIWRTVSTSEDKISSDELTSLKKAFLIKISYQIDEFIRSAIESRDRQ